MFDADATRPLSHRFEYEQVALDSCTWCGPGPVASGADEHRFAPDSPLFEGL